MVVVYLCDCTHSCILFTCFPQISLLNLEIEMFFIFSNIWFYPVLVCTLRWNEFCFFCTYHIFSSQNDPWRWWTTIKSLIISLESHPSREWSFFPSLAYALADLFAEIHVKSFLWRHSVGLPPGILFTNPVECSEPHRTGCRKDFSHGGKVYVCSTSWLSQLSDI